MVSKIRIKELEDTALVFPGVLKSYAIQAGRELRVVVESEKVTDTEASKLSFEISEKIDSVALRLKPIFLLIFSNFLLSFSPIKLILSFNSL